MKKREIRHFQNNPEQTGLSKVIPDVVFSTAQGQELTLQLIVPWSIDVTDQTYPLIVFVQGSAWTFPDVYYEIPQLARFAQSGYVVATVTHRNSLEGHPYPAFLQDVKTSIRFLRKHAEEYHIDSNRVVMFGTSSGGNTSLLVGLTGDDPEFQTEEYPEYSDTVQLVVECFGPTDLLPLAEERLHSEDTPDEEKILKTVSAHPTMTPEEVFRAMSPYYHVKDGLRYPPFLMIHGDADDVVPYDQSTKMLERMLEADMDAQLICVDGAPHEGSFWSPALWNEIKAFIDQHMLK